MLTNLARDIGCMIDAKSAHRVGTRHFTPGWSITVIGINHRDAICRHADEDTALLPRHLIKIAHAFKVGPLSVSHQRHSRRANWRQIGDFAGMIHPHLDHCGAMRGIQAKQGDGQTNIVIEVAPRGQHRITELGLEDGGNHFLGGSFSVGPRDGNQRQAELGAPGSGQTPQRQQRVIDHQRGNTGWQFAFIGHQQGGSTTGNRLFKKIMGVETRPA